MGLSRPNTGTAKSETVKVVVRCRPLSIAEIADGHHSIVEMITDKGIIELRNPREPDEQPKTFTFDAIYDRSSKQGDLYEEICRDLVNSVLSGFNGTIFAYGQTGTGKTYTMEGNVNDTEYRGVIPNSFQQIFQHIAQSVNQQYLIRASYLEIYQEEVRDLLSKDPKARLELKERPDIGVFVKDLSSFVTKSVEEIEHIMAVGNVNRTVGRTNMNEHSSRSHAIFIITVECSQPGIDGENHIRVGHLNLVDLAGSERQSKTGSYGERFKEATKINLSLSALGNVISALVDGKSSHVPYRDSKLTRLLQDSLGGNSRTVMIANIGPASYNYEETLSTLRYANRAKNIKNKPRINEDPKDALLREFQEEIARLRSILEQRTSTSTKRRIEKYSEQKNDDTFAAENYLEEQGRCLEEERMSVLANNDIIAEEKQKILDDLEERVAQLESEKEAQKSVIEKIQAIQSKLLCGDGNLLDQTKEQQKLLEQKRRQIAEQKRKEREILQQLEAQEDNTAEINETFTNLRQEVEAKTRKLKKMLVRLQQIRAEIADSSNLHSQERQDLENSIMEINKELKLKLLIVENFIPPDVRENLRVRAFWDDDADCWKLMKIGRIQCNNSETGLFEIGDSGFGNSEPSSSGVLSTISLSNRPVSIPGQRRPVSMNEKIFMGRLRQRVNSRNEKRLRYTDYPTEVEAIVPDEVMRFCGENVLTFTSLERPEKRTRDCPNTNCEFQNALDSSFNVDEHDQNMTIDASRIPILNHNKSRVTTTANARRSSSRGSVDSKNARARSALGRTATNSQIYPKARGLITGSHG